ncbi:hypothetical protein [Novibacillus thermophilus]|uniref:Uncharacterized protein n=1 Tax=Novibacillus thermophilus TaxID=1471761 RepID=A0A1U9K5G7_9BACL|nr:hypothetical protein [Novibacillus thermophilus]AQS55281.1 hypothetical protein B0W44_05285 [Novibacillus thermophilus]
MEKEKLLFGRMLGEMYRIQKKLGMQVSDARIYGLLNGVEEAIDEEIEKIGYVSNRDISAVCDVLDEYYQDWDKVSKLDGFYEVEDKLRNKGIGRSKAIRILKYLYASNRYNDLIDKFDSPKSPVEAKKFKLKEYDL